MSSLFSFKNSLKFFSFFLIYLAVVLFIGACSCGKMAGGNGNQPGGSGDNNQSGGSGQSSGDGQPKETSGEQGDKPGWGGVTTNAPWSDRFAFEALVFDDKLWVLGGNDATDSEVSDRIWFSPDGTNWNEVTPVGNVWQPRSFFQAVVFNNKMWVMGGEGRANARFGDIWSSSNGTNWTQVTPTGAWPGRNSHQQVVVFDSKMWMLGQFVGNSILQTSDGVDWKQVTPVGTYWPLRIFHQAAVFDGKMWVVGGDDGVENFRDVWSSSDGTTWTEHTVTSATTGATWKRRKSFQMLPFDGKLWVIGGKIDKPAAELAHYDDVWATTDGNRWEQISTGGPSGARRLFKVVAFKGKLWILGGADGGSVPRSDVWTFTK